MIGEQRVGDWKLICAKSGFVAFASECVKDPVSNLYVLRRFADVQHPQDYRTGIRDDPSVPFTSPEPADSFLAVGDVTSADL